MTTQPQSPVAVTLPLPTRRNAELALLCFATLITTVALLIVEANQEQGIRWDLVSYTLAFLTLFVCAHLAIRRFAPYADPLLLPVVALLNGLGLVMIHRLDLVEGSLNAATKGPNDEQQMLWTLLGVVGFSLVIIFLRITASWPATGTSADSPVLCCLPFRRCCPRASPRPTAPRSGFGCPASAFSRRSSQDPVADLLRRRAGGEAQPVHQRRPALPGDGPAAARDLAPLLAAWIASVGVMVFEKDLGTSLLLYASFLVMVYIATERFSWVVIGLALFAAGSVVAYYLFGHVRTRVETWLDPFGDPEGSGYQMVQSQFSFATGGVFGTGLGNGQPGTVPAASTDFIIAAVGEELGLVGLAGVLMLYTIVILRGLRTAIAVRDSFGKLLAAGLSATLAIQLFIVVGGVTGLIPLTGLTTPWMSYGGSSLVANYLLLAILVRISPRGPPGPSCSARAPRSRRPAPR